MAIFNQFRFCGTVYKNAQKHIIENTSPTRYYTTFTLIVRSNVTGKKNNYIPLQASGDLCEKASLLCRNGNVVAVEGEIVSREWISRKTGVTSVQLTFLVNDIMLIKKPVKTELSFKKFSQTLETASIDEYEAPKVRKKGR